MKGVLGIALNPSEAQKAFEPVLQIVFTLNDLAHKGDRDAAVALFRLAALATENLTAWCEAKPEIFSPIAADQIAWPAMHTLHKGLVRKNDALLKSCLLAGTARPRVARDRRPDLSQRSRQRMEQNHRADELFSRQERSRSCAKYRAKSGPAE